MGTMGHDQRAAHGSVRLQKQRHAGQQGADIGGVGLSGHEKNIHAGQRKGHEKKRRMEGERAYLNPPVDSVRP